MPNAPPTGLAAVPAGATGSPAGNGATAQTGRPSLWTSSAQRKMTRLYVYTTLPLNKIVELVHSRSPDSGPGHDSAHKRLNVLLDKEPRWLHPRRDSDMSRRVNELAKSPTRLRWASNASPGRSSPAWNGPGTSPGALAIGTVDDDDDDDSWKERLSWAPGGPREPPDTSASPARSAAPAISPPDDANPAEKANDAHDFADFLRRTTVLSSSTTHTTGSFRRVLSDYSEPYVRTVERLVKRFTAPTANRAGAPPSSSPCAGAVEPWCDGQERRPLVSQFGSFSMPGDCLWLDKLCGSPTCHATHEAHYSNRQCLCFVNSDLCLLPWVTRHGLTPHGESALSGGPAQSDAAMTDSFGNTVLHFVAARGSIEDLVRCLQMEHCRPWIEATNSAGQTFLHVLGGRVLERRPECVCRLLAIISERYPRLLHSRDCYGRSLFHLVRAEPTSQALLDRIAAFCSDAHLLAARDAFGVSPAAHAAPGTNLENRTRIAPQRRSDPTTSTADAGIMEQSRLLENVRLASQFPHLLDDGGRNGLHCLAMACLSPATLVNKYRPQASPCDRTTTRKQASPQQALDSGTDKLELRLGLLAGLLDAGVDPDHYDDDGNTPLMVFVANLPEDDDYKLPPRILEALVRRGGARVNARNRRGETALHIAVRCGRKLAVKTLVRLGANVHVRDAAGRSLLDVADLEMTNCEGDGDVSDYAHYEACRAWLSGKGMALQSPSVIDEWGR